MSPVILVIVCTSCEKIMPCGCAAALKGMAAWKGSIFGLYREAARNKTRTRSKSCKFHFRSQPYCNRVFRWIYWVFEENLPKRRFVALLLPSGSDVLAGFMRSPESAHFSWRQEAKADVCGCSAALKKNKKSHTIHSTPWLCGVYLMAEPAYVIWTISLCSCSSARNRGALDARLLDNLLAFPKQTYEDNAEHSTDTEARINDTINTDKCAKYTRYSVSLSAF